MLSGATRPSENLITFARGVDVLLHEAFARLAYAAGHPDVPALVVKSVERVHTTPTQAREILAKVNPGLAVFYHIDPGADFAAQLRASARKAYAGRLEVGENLMSI